MKRTISAILAIVLVCGMVFSFSACKKEEKLNFGKELLRYTSQLDALNGLKKGDADIAVIDSVMAGYYLNQSDSFKDYQIIDGLTLAEEKYGIAAAKGNEALISKVNEALIALADTKCKEVGDKYGLTNEILVTKETIDPMSGAKDASWDDLVSSKKLVIGYTVFAPIAYTEAGSSELIGFDIDLAKEVVNYWNATYSTEIEVEFVLIEWDTKETLLKNGTIDLVWNGMTITPDREEGMTISVPYLSNNQVAIIEKAAVEKYAASDYDDFVSKAADAIITVENGSAGESVVVVADEE